MWCAHYATCLTVSRRWRTQISTRRDLCQRMLPLLTKVILAVSWRVLSGSLHCFVLSCTCFFSSSSAFTDIYLGFTILGEIFVYDHFLIQPEVVAFCLHGWCILGVFLSPAFTCLGHECRDLFDSVPWNAYMCRLDLGLYSHLKEFLVNGVGNHVNSKGKMPSTWGSDEVWTMMLHQAGQRAQHTTVSAIPAPHPFPFLWPHEELTVYLCPCLPMDTVQSAGNIN